MRPRDPCRQHNPSETSRVVDVSRCVVCQTTAYSAWNCWDTGIQDEQPCPSDQVLPADGLVPDVDLSPEERAYFAEYLTPRRGFNGELVWPVDELYGGAP